MFKFIHLLTGLGIQFCKKQISYQHTFPTSPETIYRAVNYGRAGKNEDHYYELLQ